MPEDLECKAHTQTILWGIEAARVSGFSLTLRDLAYDPTNAEAKRLPGGKLGLVRSLHAKSTAKRGSQHNQTYLYPRQLGNKPLSLLKLQDVHGYPRGAVLDLKEIYLQVRCVFFTLDACLTATLTDSLACPLKPAVVH